MPCRWACARARAFVGSVYGRVHGGLDLWMEERIGYMAVNSVGALVD